MTHLGCLQDDLGPPALAFVRTVCAVLALDSALDQQTAVLRRNLLKLVHVREFASASEFKACAPPTTELASHQSSQAVHKLPC